MNTIKKFIRREYHDSVIVKDYEVPYEHVILCNSNENFNGLVLIIESVVDADKIVNYDIKYNTFSVVSTDLDVLMDSIKHYCKNDISDHIASRYDMLMNEKVFKSSFTCNDPDCIFCNNFYRPLKNQIID